MQRKDARSSSLNKTFHIPSPISRNVKANCSKYVLRIDWIFISYRDYLSQIKAGGFTIRLVVKFQRLECNILTTNISKDETVRVLGLV